ncbi:MULTISPECIES: PDR/VanB family oxidoreductase [unclassified Achromobacter]|uniref:PDR/VanB family oxidoreductase n=1 Tax=unclassified Achromobacter TaxID=2626865 RepID=UPI000B517A66|nr:MULTISPECIES: PDR/VanB family oxidoreductase [unclassified Achromobacter]OWT67304.1 oxidoreductase [Achromobacter sp. HZ34]OWT68049.1 oxidoreductase [Achromobacter sp. HZ28]
MTGIQLPHNRLAPDSVAEQYRLNRHVTTVVKRCWYETTRIKCIELEDPEGWTLPPFAPGAHIDVVLTDILVRQYSLCGDPADKHVYRIAVQREDDGRGGSALVHETLHRGTRVSVSMPRNLFALADSASRHIFIAGGIGITPFLSMIPELLRRGVLFHIHACNRSATGLPFANSLTELACNGLATLHYTDSSNPNRLDLYKRLQHQEDGEHVYFCGPGVMLDHFLKASEHWTEGTVHYERFGRAPSEGPAYSINLARTGITIEVESGEPMSTALKRHGITIRTSCEAGICGMCKTNYLGGEPDHRDHCLSTEDKARILTPCVSGSKSAVLTLDL